MKKLLLALILFAIPVSQIFGVQPNHAVFNVMLPLPAQPQVVNQQQLWAPQQWAQLQAQIQAQQAAQQAQLQQLHQQQHQQEYRQKEEFKRFYLNAVKFMGVAFMVGGGMMFVKHQKSIQDENFGSFLLASGLGFIGASKLISWVERRTS